MVRVKNGHQFGMVRYVRFLDMPFLAVLISWVCWYPLWRSGFHLFEPDATLFREPFVGFLATFHAVIAGVVTYHIWTERKDALRCLWAKDETAFALALRDRVPQSIRMFLGVMSVVVWFAFALLHYDTAFAGFFVVGAVSFILAIFYEMATSLDDLLRDPEVVAQIPKDWMSLGPRGKLYPRCILEDDTPPAEEEDVHQGLS